MIPSEYKPQTVEDFIGTARRAALMLQKGFALADGAPLKWMILGKPGIGKSALVDWFLDYIDVPKINIEEFNGTSFKVEQVDSLCESFHYYSMFDSYKVIRIEEVDKVPRVAQVRLLTLLDKMGKNKKRVLFITTSNCQPEELEERFHSRFQVFPLEAPSAKEIAELIDRHWDIDNARHIAEFACGNVRQALLDVQTKLMQV